MSFDAGMNAYEVTLLRIPHEGHWHARAEVHPVAPARPTVTVGDSCWLHFKCHVRMQSTIQGCKLFHNDVCIIPCYRYITAVVRR